MKKSTQLKSLIQSKDLSFLMEAHHGLSAKIVQEAGFQGIWASGLSLSASLGVRDNNEASWTQIIDVLEFMSDATRIPILLDGDTGYGNFNNVRRLIKKLEQREIAGVCIEDKLFPKTNSFINSEQQPLADIDEFCGKIKAAKDTQSDPDFCVVARVEAFIANLGLDEALKRAHAYQQAGADAILIHSKKSTAEDICSFMEVWDRPTPIIIVPTKYASTPTDLFRQLGISTVIWANHTLRSSIFAMQKTVKQIFNDQHLQSIGHHTCSVSEIFRLQGSDELEKAEKNYLPGNTHSLASITLAAGPSSLGELTKDCPKSLLSIQNKPLLHHQLDTYSRFNIHDHTVVIGHHKTAFDGEGYQTIENNDFSNTSEVYSLSLAQHKLNQDCIIAYGDILFRDSVLHDCLNAQGDITIMVDASYHSKTRNDWVVASEPFDRTHFMQHPILKKASRSDFSEGFHGTFIGLLKCSKKGSLILQNQLSDLSLEDLKTYTMPDFLTHCLAVTPIHIIYIQGGWVDVNTLSDLQTAHHFHA